MTRRATAQDVADLAGVSRSTVSLVLNGRAEGNVSRVKQEAVRHAAEQLRYTPDAVALSLRSKRTATIGVLTWPDRRHMPLALLGAVYTAASQAGYLLVMVDAVRRPRQVDALLDRRVDGFVVVAPELTAYTVPESVVTAPTVMVNCFDDALDVASLVPDEEGAGASAAGLLLDAGHREVAVLAGTGLASERRVAGVCRALAEAASGDAVVVGAGHSVDDGFTAARRLLRSDDRPSGLVCTHERLALGALLAATDLGLRVPDDVSLVSLDDGEDLSGLLVPPIARVERPDEVIAGYALDLLVDQLREGRTHGRRLTFVCPVSPGSSVGPPRGRAARRP
jgi:LacI family transcriptional regulator